MTQDITSDTIPLEDFIEGIRTALGVVPPDLEELFRRLRFASGPEIPGLIVQVLLFVPQVQSEDDQPSEYRDYERF